MEKAIYPRQDREKGVISNLLPKISADTVDDGLGLLKISSVVDGTDVRGLGTVGMHSYKWRMAIESSVQSIAVVPDRFFDVKGKSYPIDYNRKVSVLDLPDYENYKDAVIYKINSRSRCVFPPLAKIIFDGNMTAKGKEVEFTNIEYTVKSTDKYYNKSSLALGTILKNGTMTTEDTDAGEKTVDKIYESQVIKIGDSYYISNLNLTSKFSHEEAEEGENHVFHIDSLKLFKFNEKPNDCCEHEIEYDALEASLVNYAQNHATTELAEYLKNLTSEEKETIYGDLSLGDYLAIIVDANDDYHALVGTRYVDTSGKNIIEEDDNITDNTEGDNNAQYKIIWQEPSTAVNVSQFKGIDMWLRFESLNSLIYFLITKYENDIVSIQAATIDENGSDWAVNKHITEVIKNDDVEAKKVEGKLWAYVNPRTMTPYPDDYWFHQYEPYYVKSLTLAPKNKKLKGRRIEVKAGEFPGMYMIVGETYIRNRDTGEDERMQLKFPLCKIKSDQSLTLQADGDPVTWNFNVEVATPPSGIMMEITAYEIAKKLEENEEGCFVEVDGSTEVLSE